MAITFLCPACGAVATVSDESRGMSGVCGHCKLRLRVPTAIKFCVACHKDVASEKRIKDPNGFYYCEPCYADRVARKSAGAAKSPVTVASGLKMPAAPPSVTDSGNAMQVEGLEEQAVQLDDLPVEGHMITRKRKAVAAISSVHTAPAVPTPAPAAAEPAPAEDLALEHPDESLALPAIAAAKTPAVPAAKPPAAEGGEFDLADDTEFKPVKKEAPPAPAAVGVAAAAVKPQELPSKCPNCGTPRIGKSVLCVGCKRDLRQMGNLIKMQQDTSEDKANRVAKIVGWSIGGVVIVAVVLVVGWAVWVRVLDMMGPAKDVWPETAAALTADQKKDIEDNFKHLQDDAAMVRVLSDGQKLQVNMMWWGARPKDAKIELINKLSLYSQMHSGKADVVVVSDTSNVTVAEKKDGKVTLIDKPAEPIAP